MHKPDFRLSARRLRSPAIGLVILTLLCQRLLDALPVTDSAAWMINDTLRAASFAAMAWLAYLLTPFDWLRGKWLMAATLGYSVADVAGSVYQFKRGRLVRQPLGERHKHMRAIPGRLAVPADLAALDALVGTRWRLIDANCLTLLARRWREDYRVR